MGRGIDPRVRMSGVRLLPAERTAVAPAAQTAAVGRTVIDGKPPIVPPVIELRHEHAEHGLEDQAAERMENRAHGRCSRAGVLKSLRRNLLDHTGKDTPVANPAWRLDQDEARLALKGDTAKNCVNPKPSEVLTCGNPGLLAVHANDRHLTVREHLRPVERQTLLKAEGERFDAGLTRAEAGELLAQRLDFVAADSGRGQELAVAIGEVCQVWINQQDVPTSRLREAKRRPGA
jgi:hypothetical protein